MDLLACMDFDRRRLIIAFVLIGLLVVAGWLGGRWYWGRPSALPPVSTPTASPAPAPAAPRPAVGPAAPKTEAERSALRLARLFAERFATFSSQSRYEGITELAEVTTDRFRQWLTSSYIPSLQAEHPATAYSGQTTRVLSIELKEATPTTATAVAQVQQEFTAAAGSTVRYTTLTVGLTKKGAGWLVDSARFVSP